MALASVLIMLTSAAAMAQDAKPWLTPGTQAGQEIFGPDGRKYVWVPSADFRMGTEDGEADQKPVHRVRLSKGFWLSKCEVTVEQWLHYCKVAKVLLRAEIITPLDHPMGGINWDDCVGYCRFYGMSLPTEAQWEWAAKGPESRKYPWGNEWDASLCCNDDNVGPTAFTAPVGSFPRGASWCGALDMAGNLDEWCADWYSKDTYAFSAESDPQGPASGQKRVLRGGYCWGRADDCTTTRRVAMDPANDGGSGGLRPCLVP